MPRPAPVDSRFRPALRALGRGATFDPRERAVRGHARGVAITVHYSFFASEYQDGHDDRASTQIEAAADAGELVLALRRRAPGDGALVARGLAVDVPTGDVTFDGAFLVEAAPADVARALLDPDLRAALLARGVTAVVTTDRGVRLTAPTWVADRGGLEALIGLATDLSLGIAAAHRRVEQGAAGYRGPARAGDERRRVEIDALRAILARRAALAARRGRLALGAGVAAYVALFYQLVLRGLY
jgi:hypothetical protein